MLDCYLLEHALVRYLIAIALSLSLHKALVFQTSPTYLWHHKVSAATGTRKENTTDNSTMANALAVIAGVLIVQERVLPAIKQQTKSKKPRNDVMLIPAPSFLKVVTEQDRQTMDLLESYI